MADSKSSIVLDNKFTTYGKIPGGKYNPQSNTTSFEGKVTVSEDIAEDLLRRQQEYKSYEASLIRDNGHTGIHVEDIK